MSNTFSEKDQKILNMLVEKFAKKQLTEFSKHWQEMRNVDSLPEDYDVLSLFAIATDYQITMQNLAEFLKNGAVVVDKYISMMPEVLAPVKAKAVASLEKTLTLSAE